ncbi:protein SPMIP1-like [Mantella aurantiaca]
MERKFNITTQKQEFLKECYVKEILTRARWHRRYGQNFPRLANTKIKTPKAKDRFKLPAIADDAFRGSMEEKRSERRPEKRSEPVQEDLLSPKGVKERDGGEATGFTETLMRPASPGTLSLLYSGTSNEQQGRYRYMNARNQLKPEDKYTQPLLSSWEYGWQMGDVTGSDGGRYRRCRIVSDTFFSKNGIPQQPHPKDMAL